MSCVFIAIRPCVVVSQVQTLPAEKAPQGVWWGGGVPAWAPWPAGTCPPPGLASRLKFVESSRGGAIGPRAPALRVSCGRLPRGPCKTPHLGPGGPPGADLVPSTQALRGWRRRQASSPHPQENFTPSSLPPSLNFYHTISVRLSVSRSFCRSVPPSSPGTTDTGPQPSDLGGHRASHIPCPSLTPGG